MYEKTWDIQNKLLKAFKNFTLTRDIEQWQKDVESVKEAYRFNKVFLEFCIDEAMGYAKLVNGIKEWEV